MAAAPTLREISALLKESGSYEAAIQARPDLADELRDLQRQGEQIRERLGPAIAKATENMGDLARVTRALANPGPPRALAKMPSAKDRFERDVRVLETALARHSRTQAKKQRGAKMSERRQLSEKQKALYKHYPNRTFAKVLALLEQGKDISEVARETELKRQDVDKFVLWQRGGVYDLVPGRIPNTVIFVKSPKTA